jgi:hypothetical protein
MFFYRNLPAAKADETAVRATPASLLAVPGMIIVNLTLPQKQLRQLARALVTSKSGIY